MGNGPARCSCQEAEPFLQGYRIDFIDDAVDVIRQFCADLHQSGKIVVYFLQAVTEFVEGISGKAPFF